MKKYILFFCYANTFLPFYAQEVFQQVNTVADYVLLKDSRLHHIVENTEVEGSPYLNDLFIEGDIYMVKDTFRHVPMRYDVYNDWIEFKKKEVIYILDPLPYVLKVKIGDHTLEVQPYVDHGKLKSGFFKILDNHKITLLSKKTIQFQERKLAKALESSNTPPKYKSGKDTYYVRVAHQAAVLLHAIKNLTGLIPDHQKAIESFVKRNKTSLHEADLLKLMEYYNKLDK